MIRGKISFQIWAQDNNTFWMIFKKIRQKWLVKKSKFVWRKKKPTPSTNIPLLSYRKSEQKQKITLKILLNWRKSSVNRGCGDKSVCSRSSFTESWKIRVCFPKSYWIDSIILKTKLDFNWRNGFLFFENNAIDFWSLLFNCLILPW